MSARVPVDDVRVEGSGEYYLVGPREAAGPGVIFLHWFDEAPNANRSQFLREAQTLAGHGIVSILPQLSFPWSNPPTDIETDLGRIAAELSWLRKVHAALTEVDGVDPARIVVVGHDFGAMHGTLLLREIEARAAVLIAATPRWADWFLRFWPIASDRFDYMRALDAVDPIRAVPSAGCPLLFQFGLRDFYIAQMTAAELFQTASEPKSVAQYDTGHEIALDEATNDRIEFVLDSLGISP